MSFATVRTERRLAYNALSGSLGALSHSPYAAYVQEGYLVSRF